MSAKERPIIFSAPMVRALLEGRKTQTRRVMRLPSHIVDHGEVSLARMQAGYPDGLRPVWEYDDEPNAFSTRNPYGVPGDRLWVRETFKTSEYHCDEEPQGDDYDHKCSAHCHQAYVYYAATPREGFRPKPDRARITYLDESTPLTDWYVKGWKPSIHMPRWASRLTIEITEVRVQRLHDISEEDARAEGCRRAGGATGQTVGMGGPETARIAFEMLWNGINGPGSWDANPWVWALSFKRLPTPEASVTR